MHCKNRSKTRQTTQKGKSSMHETDSGNAFHLRDLVRVLICV
jgi:hypothetical protein